MIKNIVFDIGNVLVDYCWQDHIRRFGFDEPSMERIGRAMMQSPVWNEIDRGVWTNEEILQGFIQNDPELEKEIRLVFSDLGTLVRERSGSIPWIRELKTAGYMVYYLSNFSDRVKREAADQLHFLPEMDGGIMSYEIQLIKPDAAIYEALFEKYRLKPEESVFLDDSEKNIDAARKLHMHGILVNSQEQAKQELKELLETVNM